MEILIEVSGTIRVPFDTAVCDSFVAMIKKQGWHFCGGFRDSDSIEFGGTVSSERDLTLEDVRHQLTDWFREQGWSFDADFRYILETENLILRRAEFDDWKPMYENVWRHESAARYMQWDVTTSEEAARDRIERTIRYQQNGGLSFIVTKTDEPIGFAGVMETEPGVYEDTGGCLGPDFQRKGYGKQMLAALERLVFSRGGSKFIVGHRRENLPSKKVILARGFRYTHSEEKDYGILDFYEKRRNT